MTSSMTGYSLPSTTIRLPPPHGRGSEDVPERLQLVLVVRTGFPLSLRPLIRLLRDPSSAAANFRQSFIKRFIAPHHLTDLEKFCHPLTSTHPLSPGGTAPAWIAMRLSLRQILSYRPDGTTRPVSPTIYAESPTSVTTHGTPQAIASPNTLGKASPQEEEEDAISNAAVRRGDHSEGQGDALPSMFRHSEPRIRLGNYPSRFLCRIEQNGHLAAWCAECRPHEKIPGGFSVNRSGPQGRLLGHSQGAPIHHVPPCGRRNPGGSAINQNHLE